MCCAASIWRAVVQDQSQRRDDVGSTQLQAQTASPSQDQAIVSFTSAVRVWFKISLLSFGGPAGQIAVMHRLLVEELKWVSEKRFLHALNFCMLLPGPEAQQLTIYLGWILHRLRGGVVAGVLFVLPGAITVLALSMIYVSYQQAVAVSSVFFGVKAAVLAVVAAAVWRLAQKILKRLLLMTITCVAFIASFVFSVPFPLVIAGAALAGFFMQEDAPQDEDETAQPAEVTGRSTGWQNISNGRQNGGRRGSFLSAVRSGCCRSFCYMDGLAQAISSCSRGCFSVRLRWSLSEAPMRCCPTWRNRRLGIMAG